MPGRGIALALVVFGCTRNETSRGDDVRPLELLVANAPETLDPRYAVDAVGMRTTRLIHAGLVRLDATTLEPVPYVARAYTWVGPHALRVELRTDVRFHSGAKLTPEDVIATIDALRSPAVASRHARVVDAIGAVKKDGENAVIFELSRDHATLLTDLEVPILRASEAASPPRPDGSLDGLGPYRVVTSTRAEVELAPSGSGVLVRNAAIEGADRGPHAVVIRTVHDENARALRFHAGRADVAVNAFSPPLLPALEGRKDVHVVARPGANLTYLLPRNDRGPFADARVRRALAHAIDRRRLARTLLAGRAQVAETLVPPTHWAHTALDAPLAFDPAAARALLDEAGLRPDAQGVRLRATYVTSTDRTRLAIARVIAQDAAAVGIALEILPLELGTMIARLNAGDFDLASLQLPELTEPNVFRVFLHSASVPPNGANRARVRDAEVDALLERASAVNDRELRRALYADVERRVRDAALWVPLFHEDQVAVTSERAAWFVPSAEGRWLGLAWGP